MTPTLHLLLEEIEKSIIEIVVVIVNVEIVGIERVGRGS